MIEMENIIKTYQLGEMEVPVLKGINLYVAEGDYISIMGASGSGKSTLMNIIGCLDRPALLLADEPTGALDTQTSQEVMKLFDNLNSQGITIVIITHEPEIAAQTRRKIVMQDGLIVG
ncbi:ATP-binding cassette domain-containing protein [Chamaesiphon polymorphus]|nr:ATP-binding cassette domain-containing protein [Chamaesiphon polymorphus]